VVNTLSFPRSWTTPSRSPIAEHTACHAPNMPPSASYRLRSSQRRILFLRWQHLVGLPRHLSLFILQQPRDMLTPDACNGRANDDANMATPAFGDNCWKRTFVKGGNCRRQAGGAYTASVWTNTSLHTLHVAQHALLASALWAFGDVERRCCRCLGARDAAATPPTPRQLPFEKVTALNRVAL